MESCVSSDLARVVHRSGGLEWDPCDGALGDGVLEKKKYRCVVEYSNNLAELAEVEGCCMQ